MPPCAAPPLDDQHWQPATLRDRGVAVPFTTPALAGARLRVQERRHELVLPHPGGARGVYVLALASLCEFCAPTLHDARLAERLAGAPAAAPAGVREAARAVAAEGAAGRAAAAAAVRAATAEAGMTAAFEALLLDTLVRGPQAADCAAEPDHRARAAIHQLAGRTGRTPQAVSTDLALLAARLAKAGLDLPAGASGGAAPGRCRTLLGAMQATAGSVRDWARDAGEQPAAVQVAGAALAMAEAGRLVLDAAQKLLADPASLLASWASAPEAVAARIGRADWLLDGWEPICLLWRVAEADDSRAGGLAEAALLLPPVPAEAAGWFATLPALQARLRARHAAGALPRAGGRVPSQAVGLTDRNERIRALAA